LRQPGQKKVNFSSFLEEARSWLLPLEISQSTWTYRVRELERRKEAYPFLTFVTTDPLKTVISFLRISPVDLNAVITVLLLFIGE